jgi:sugar fermentation stimulation protein A
VKLADPFRNGSFSKRVNRFLGSIHINGKDVFAHVPNTGRMRELLTPGRSIMLRQRRSQKRKTRYDLSFVNYYGRWVSIDARLSGVLRAESIEK